ncbi:uncharacterized protein LOC120355087 isoform X2 [Nilaparvata lugens]|uniref:uncharacterized protein LOC120355087 isoform X2 n=1 Tax=Nilaparvata lugens TaxID=108931 RepID=UPI00193CA4D3|nr:uncharacterized protein LOC120355087 isoform X2 [Nilaparvata lugens]
MTLFPGIFLGNTGQVQDIPRTLCAVWVYGKSNSFERGKEKLKEAEIYTDLSTDCEEPRKHQRRHRAKKMFLSLSDESSDELARDVLPLPTVPNSILGTPESLDTEIITKKFPQNTSTPETSNLTKSSCEVQASSVNTPPLRSNQKASNDTDKPNSAHALLRANSELNYK